MGRFILLVAAALLTGCAPTRPQPCVAGLPIPKRVVESVNVHGAFEDVDVQAILGLVRAQTDEPVLHLVESTRPRDPNLCPGTVHDLSVPARAQVMTGVQNHGLDGYGSMFYLTHSESGWVITQRSGWIS